MAVLKVLFWLYARRLIRTLNAESQHIYCTFIAKRSRMVFILFIPSRNNRTQLYMFTWHMLHLMSSMTDLFPFAATGLYKRLLIHFANCSSERAVLTYPILSSNANSSCSEEGKTDASWNKIYTKTCLMNYQIYAKHKGREEEFLKETHFCNESL